MCAFVVGPKVLQKDLWLVVLCDVYFCDWLSTTACLPHTLADHLTLVHLILNMLIINTSMTSVIR